MGPDRTDGHRRAEEWSLYYHRLVAQKLRDAPEAVLAKARRNLAEMRRLHGPSVEPYAARWEELLDGPVEELLQALSSPSEEDRALRQCTPFAGVLSPRERWEAYRAWSHERRRADAARPT
ncbi:MAG: hypothetical protein K6U79_03340 [Firmicutes bacterium]|nr:hypothetical protein [Bacillota bacterium]